MFKFLKELLFGAPKPIGFRRVVEAPEGWYAISLTDEWDSSFIPRMCVGYCGRALVGHDLCGACEDAMREAHRLALAEERERVLWDSPVPVAYSTSTAKAVLWD